MSPASAPHKRRSVPPSDPSRHAPSAERPLRAKSRLMEHQMDIHPHVHEWGQLVFSMSGAVRVSAQNGQRQHSYMVPPSRAVWIPPGVIHAVTAIQEARLYTVYLHESALPKLVEGNAPDLWTACRVLEVSPLLRELVIALAVDTDALAKQGPSPSVEGMDTSPDSDREPLIAQLLLNELRRARSLQLGLPLPQDKRLRRVCEAMLAAPLQHADLEGWAAASGASARTLSRLFSEELGCSYSQWRQQLLLAHALQLAARKHPMNLIAAELGYASASAFSAMVTRAVGMPPSRFFAEA